MPIDISAFLTEAEYGNGLQVIDHVISAKLGEDTATNKNFLDLEGDEEGKKSLAVRSVDTDRTFTTDRILVAGGPLDSTNLRDILPKDDSDTEGRICDISKITNTLIKRIGKSCFHGCKNMRRVDIPSTVSSIGDNAFEYCENLCEIHLTHSTPPTIGANIFEGVREDFKIFVPEESLEKYFNNEGWSKYAQHIYPKPRNNDIIYYYDGNKLDGAHTSISSSEKNGNYYKISNISNGTLPTSYFTNKPSLKKVILGDNITKINKNAFKNCNSLINVIALFVSD